MKKIREKGYFDVVTFESRYDKVKKEPKPKEMWRVQPANTGQISFSWKNADGDYERLKISGNNNTRWYKWKSMEAIERPANEELYSKRFEVVAIISDDGWCNAISFTPAMDESLWEDEEEKEVQKEEETKKGADNLWEEVENSQKNVAKERIKGYKEEKEDFLF